MIKIFLSDKCLCGALAVWSAGGSQAQHQPVSVSEEPAEQHQHHHHPAPGGGRGRGGGREDHQLKIQYIVFGLM